MSRRNLSISHRECIVPPPPPPPPNIWEVNNSHCNPEANALKHEISSKYLRQYILGENQGNLAMLINWYTGSDITRKMVLNGTTSHYSHLASSPGLRPDFISQPWRKIKIWAEAWERGQLSPMLADSHVSSMQHFTLTMKLLISGIILTLKSSALEHLEARLLWHQEYPHYPQ